MNVGASLVAGRESAVVAATRRSVRRPIGIGLAARPSRCRAERCEGRRRAPGSRRDRRRDRTPCRRAAWRVGAWGDRADARRLGSCRASAAACSTRGHWPESARLRAGCRWRRRADAASPELSTVRRVGARLLAPPFAHTFETSSAARDQSIRSACPSSSSITRCSRSHTPASCQSRSRRQHVLPEPQPISCGR
jgi:hypothetical protein